MPLVTLVVLCRHRRRRSAAVSDRRAASWCWPADTATLFVLATGVTFVIMLGGIDLSIQAMASLASVIVALTVARLGYGSFVARGRSSARWPASLAGLAHVKLKHPVLHRHAGRRRRARRHGPGHLQARSITLDEARARLLSLDHRHELRASRNVIFIGADRADRSPTSCRAAPASAATAPPSAPARPRPTPRASRSAGRRCSPSTLSRRLRRARRRDPAPGGWPAARRPSPTSCCCRRSPPWSSAAPRSPAASAASGAPLIGALIISVVRIGMTFVGVNIFAQKIVFGAVLIAGRRHHHRPQQDPDRQIGRQDNGSGSARTRSP